MTDTVLPTAGGDLAGRRAVVTGATGATGGAVVARLVAAGAAVLGVARKSPAESPNAAVAFVAADLATAEGPQIVARRVAERFGRADVIVHVAGGSRAGSGGFAALDEAVWDDELQLNLLAEPPHRRRHRPHRLKQERSSTLSQMLVDRYFARAAAPDLDAYLAQFTDDAVAEDEDRLHEGIAAIRAWRTGVPPVSYTVTTVEPTEEGHRATAEIVGDFPGSPVSLTFGFAFRGGKIRRLTIRPVPG